MRALDARSATPNGSPRVNSQVERPAAIRLRAVRGGPRARGRLRAAPRVRGRAPRLRADVRARHGEGGARADHGVRPRAPSPNEPRGGSRARSSGARRPRGLGHLAHLLDGLHPQLVGAALRLRQPRDAAWSSAGGAPDDSASGRRIQACPDGRRPLRSARATRPGPRWTWRARSAGGAPSSRQPPRVQFRATVFQNACACCQPSLNERAPASHICCAC